MSSTMLSIANGVKVCPPPIYEVARSSSGHINAPLLTMTFGLFGF